MNYKRYLFLILLIITTFFVHLSALPSDIMEERNLVTAREMADDGHWMIPTMNGELRLEKPPLPTWVAGVVECVAPDNIAAQRSMAGVMGTIAIVFFFLIIRDVSGGNTHIGLLACAVLMTMYQTVLMGRTATWDIYCHAFMLGAIYFLGRGLRAPACLQWRWFPWAGLCLGLSFLSKGPVSFYAMLLPVIIAAFGLPSLSAKGKWPAISAMIVIALVVGAWWYVWLLTMHPVEAAAVFHKESGAWSHHNVRPWYYYWRFFLETGIWALPMVASLFIGYWKRNINIPHVYLFAITWTLAALVLLSLMPEKKMRYLLPMMPPCALCVACLLYHWQDAADKVSRILCKVQGSLTVVVAVGIAVAIFFLRPLALWACVILAAALIAIAAYVLVSTIHNRPIGMVCGVALIFMLAECFLLKPVGKMFGNPDEHSIAAVNTMSRLKDVPFYHPEDDPLRIELIYAAHRKIRPINLSDTATIVHRTPFVLVTSGDYQKAITLPAGTKTLPVGSFDDNKHRKSNRHYTDLLTSRAVLVLRDE